MNNSRPSLRPCSAFSNTMPIGLRSARPLLSALLAVLLACGSSAVNAETIAAPLVVDPGVVGDQAQYGTTSDYSNTGGVLEIAIDFGSKAITVPPEFSYTAAFVWNVAVSQTPVFTDWVLLQDGTRIDLDAGNIESKGTSVTANGVVNTTTIGAALGAISPVASYHARVDGLPLVDPVVFTGSGIGGSVVPEPSSSVMMMLGALLGVSWLRRRERRS